MVQVRDQEKKNRRKIIGIRLTPRSALELPLVESAAAKPAFQRTFIPAMISRVLGVSIVDNTSPAANSGTQDVAAPEGNDNETSIPESSEAPKPQQTKNRKGAKSKTN
jgi:hypothetical protein